MHQLTFPFCGSLWFSRCKVIYYMFFSWMYGLVGSCAHLVMVNSSWTRSHINELWRIPQRIKRVYPPCDTSSLQVGWASIPPLKTLKLILSCVVSPLIVMHHLFFNLMLYAWPHIQPQSKIMT